MASSCPLTSTSGPRRRTSGSPGLQNFASPEGAAFDEPRIYTVPSRLHTNQWALAGEWTIGSEQAVNTEANGRIEFRCHARDVNLILVPPARGTSARFRVRLDGNAPAHTTGLDVDEHGHGVITEPRLYQLIRQTSEIEDRSFEIEFLDPGVAALCLTFG